MVNNAVSVRIIESLRRGIPPQQGVNRYSVGNEKLIEGITRYHLSGIKDRGIFRFINGSWGAGKTHLFRQLRENAFQSECLVSSVELDTTSTALNSSSKFFILSSGKLQFLPIMKLSQMEMSLPLQW
jgi:hypothetical protein